MSFFKTLKKKTTQNCTVLLRKQSHRWVRDPDDSIHQPVCDMWAPSVHLPVFVHITWGLRSRPLIRVWDFNKDLTAIHKRKTGNTYKVASRTEVGDNCLSIGHYVDIEKNGEKWHWGNMKGWWRNFREQKLYNNFNCNDLCLSLSLYMYIFRYYMALSLSLSLYIYIYKCR